MLSSRLHLDSRLIMERFIYRAATFMSVLSKGPFLVEPSDSGAWQRGAESSTRGSRGKTPTRQHKQVEHGDVGAHCEPSGICVPCKAGCCLSDAHLLELVQQHSMSQHPHLLQPHPQHASEQVSYASLQLHHGHDLSQTLPCALLNTAPSPSSEYCSGCTDCSNAALSSSSQVRCAHSTLSLLAARGRTRRFAPKSEETRRKQAKREKKKRKGAKTRVSARQRPMRRESA